MYPVSNSVHSNLHILVFRIYKKNYEVNFTSIQRSWSQVYYTFFLFIYFLNPSSQEKDITEDTIRW
jgi:hypothetical protein